MVGVVVESGSPVGGRAVIRTFDLADLSDRELEIAAAVAAEVEFRSRSSTLRLAADLIDDALGRSDAFGFRVHAEVVRDRLRDEAAVARRETSAWRKAFGAKP